MNDIEILENLLEEGFEAMCPLEAEAIANLIQRNKELEQIEKEHKKEKVRLREKIKELEKEKEEEFKRGFFTKVNESHKHTIKIESQVIPKMKVREKIEELKKERKKQDEKNTINLFYDQIDITNIIKVLQELLEESEK